MSNSKVHSRTHSKVYSRHALEPYTGARLWSFAVEFTVELAVQRTEEPPVAQVFKIYYTVDRTVCLTLP